MRRRQPLKFPRELKGVNKTPEHKGTQSGNIIYFRRCLIRTVHCIPYLSGDEGSGTKGACNSRVQIYKLYLVDYRAQKESPWL